MRKFIPLLTALVALTVPATSLAATDIEIAQKHWGGSCATRPVHMYFDHDIAVATSTGGKVAGSATGLTVLDEKNEIWVLQDCSFTVDPTWWATASPYDRCVLVVHEMGHLAGHHHSEGGVMAANSAGVEGFSGCEVRLTFVDRVDRYIISTPAAQRGGQWTCADKKRGVRICNIEFKTPAGHAKVARYRFRLAGDKLVAKRADLR